MKKDLAGQIKYEVTIVVIFSNKKHNQQISDTETLHSTIS